MPDNPFHYGEVVRGTDFTDRELELKSLVAELSGQTRIFLVSPRRYGKTSLITRALEELRSKGRLTVYIDLFRASSVEEFADLYAKSIFSAAESTIDKTLRFVKEMLPTLSPEISLDEEGKPSLSLGLRHGRTRNLEEIFDLPQKVAKKKGKRMVVAIDEFQEITGLGGEKFEKALRSHMQTHDAVSYLFAGSKRHVLTDMVTNRARAFYASGKLISLGKIPEDLFVPYLLQKFRKTGFRAAEETLREILRETDNIPNNVQMLCHELWEICRDRKVVEAGDLPKAIASLVKTRSVLYSATWDSLSLHQRRLLKAVALEGSVAAPTASRFIRQYDLAAPTSVQRSIERLVDRDILDKQDGNLTFTDPFLKYWIRFAIA